MGHVSCTHSGVHGFMVKTYNVSSREINFMTLADSVAGLKGGESVDLSNT